MDIRTVAPRALESVVHVVDNDESVRLSICEMLDSVGITAEGFGSTKDLMAAAVFDNPGCVILDVRMPGVSGLDFQAELTAKGLQVSIIFLTGHGDTPMAEKAIEDGAIEFLSKPVDDHVLLDAVEKAIRIDRKRRETVARYEEPAPGFQGNTHGYR